MIDFNSDIKFATDKNINKVDDAGKTALIWAVYNKNLEMVNALLDKGADREIKGKNGKRAIDYASDAIKPILMK